MAKSHILIVSEDASFRATLARWLLGAGFAVELAESARRAREVVASENLNLAIVDERVATADAELAGEIAERIKVLVAQAEKESGAMAESSGADLAWPFSEQDLLERLSQELESAPATGMSYDPQRLHFEGYMLDADARSCLDAKGQHVALTRAEFSLLLAFARQPGRVLSRDELTHVVAGRGAEPDDRSVDVLISRLRRKIEPDPKAPRLIVTMPGEGYKFTARPQAVISDPAMVAMAAPATTEAPGDDAALRSAEALEAAGRKSSRSALILRVLVPAAAVVLMAILGWEAWSIRQLSRQAAEVPHAIAPAMLAERRAAAFKRMAEAFRDDRFTWRTIERLAVEAGVDEAEAREILSEHVEEVVLGKSREGKPIARLTSR